MADFGSSEAGKKGGRARANALTPEERREIARNAALARWDSDAPQATHEGSFELGDATVSAAVLPDGTRLLSQGTFLLAIGRARTPKAGTGVMTTVDDTPFFLQADILKPFITNELKVSTKPVFFRSKSGVKMVGYNAEALPDVAEVYLKMRDGLAAQNKSVPHHFAHIVTACDIVMRSFAKVGIIALVDEATGYQFDRPRRDLEEHLKKYVSESLRRWVRTFPDDYLRHLCRLRGVELRHDRRLPSYFGHLTNDLVYRRIAPNLVKKLKERRNEKGKPSNKLHSWLSMDIGLPELLFHLGGVVHCMKGHTNYEEFYKELDRDFPAFPESPGLFDDPKDWEER